MSENRTHILNHSDILLKIERMAWQIMERYHNVDEIILFGIAPKGEIVAELLSKSLKSIGNAVITRGVIKIEKSNPNSDSISVTGLEGIENKHVVIVDDVLNSGKTLMYAIIPLLKEGPKSLHTVVLANRDHASFPVRADIVGISLATTLQEHITFERNTDGQMSVYLT